MEPQKANRFRDSEEKVVLGQLIRQFDEGSGFTLTASEPVRLLRDGLAARCKAISPFVWREGESYRCIFRMVPRRSAKDLHSWLMPARGDGIHFTLGDDSVLRALTIRTRTVVKIRPS